MIPYNKLFIFFAISFLCFVYITNFFIFESGVYLIIIMSALFFLNVYTYIKHLKYFFVAILLWAWAWTYTSIIHSEYNAYKVNFIESYNTTLSYEVILEIESVYKIKEHDVSYIAKLTSLDRIEPEKDIHILLNTKSNFWLSTWDRLSIFTPISPVKNFNTNFDYKSFLQTKNIYSTLYSYNFENLWNNKPSERHTLIQNLRSSMLWVIHILYPRDEAVFLWWVLIGARESLPEELSSAFNNSGLTHLIAVSGYNITIIIVFLTYVLSYIPKYIRSFIIIAAILFYVQIVGDSPAVVRAATMWIVGYVVLTSWRKGDSLAIICFTAMLMLLYNPLSINYDLWFQLSFGAVLWLLYTQDFFKKMFFFLPNKFALQESFVLTLSAFVFTLPIMIFNFGQVSVLAPIANLLVGWSIPFAMLFGFISVGLYYINPVWAYAVWFVEFILLKVTTSVGYLFWWFSASILEFEFWTDMAYLQILYYLIILFFILYRKKQPD